LILINVFLIDLFSLERGRERENTDAQQQKELEMK